MPIQNTLGSNTTSNRSRIILKNRMILSPTRQSPNHLYGHLVNRPFSPPPISRHPRASSSLHSALFIIRSLQRDFAVCPCHRAVRCKRATAGNHYTRAKSTPPPNSPLSPSTKRIPNSPTSHNQYIRCLPRLYQQAENQLLPLQKKSRQMHRTLRQYSNRAPNAINRT